MQLLLIRHGQTPSNVQGLLDTAAPGAATLTELGRTQARALPLVLEGQRVDAILASTLTRTQLTAEPLARARGIIVQVHAGLREVQAGELEMLGGADAIGAYLGAIGTWMAGDLDVRIPGGETGREVLDRVDLVVHREAEALQARVGDHAALAVVAHGAVLRFWASVRADNVPATYGARNALHNTGIIVLDGSPGSGWRVLTWMGSAVEDLDEQPDGPAGEALVVRSDLPRERWTGG